MSRLDPTLRARLDLSRVAHLGTVRRDGTPHVVPITFALLGEQLVTAIDHKPKSSRDLQRLRNIEHQPAVTVLVDHYEDDWTRIWWVRADGHAEVVPAERAPEAIAALTARYPAYREHPPQGPVIVVTVDRWRAWHA